jgi:Spy/CpxP family protein refolding chaperone
MEIVMKKFMVGIGLAMALAGTAAAQHPGHDGPAKREQGERRGRGGPDGLLLKGIELTEGQRTQIAQLRKAQRDTMDVRGHRGARGAEMDAIRQARQRGDTAAVSAEMAKLRQAREQERAQHIAAIRTILTAQQRVQFDKNVAELKQRETERAHNGRKADRPGRGPGKR